MKQPLSIVAMLACATSLTGPARASGTPVSITVTGTVEYNAISVPPLNAVLADDPAKLTFRVSSDVFVDSPNFPTRGYRIDPNSFVLEMGAVKVALANPLPAGQTPYFVLRDNDPAVDGFLVSTNVDFPTGVPLSASGGLGALRQDFYVTYGGSTLASLDILGALGTYGFGGLSVFNWTIDDGPFQPLGLIFSSLEIKALSPGPSVYCTAKVNSQGCSPSLSTDAGLPSFSGGAWHVLASNLINQKPGLFFYAFGRNSVPFSGGTLCLLPPVQRTSVQSSGGQPPPDDCSGALSLDVTSALPATLAGALVDFQAWSRDPLAPFGTSLSNAVEVLLCP